MMRRTITIILLICLSILLSSCLNFLRYHGPCRWPKKPVTVEAVVGAWQILYDEYLSVDEPSSRISGTETILINADGTYTQSFESREYNYVSDSNPWELVLNEGDGPKLKMYDLVYFANGLDFVGGPLNLSIQQSDYGKYRDSYGYSPDLSATLGVDYPADGFVYLYPRKCFDMFGLVQMDSRMNDPDAPIVDRPVFTRVNTD